MFILKNEWELTFFLFRFGNKIIQVSFLDKTELLISTETKIMVYMDEKGY